MSNTNTDTNTNRSQDMLNQALYLYEEEHQEEMSTAATQMVFFSLPPNTTIPPITTAGCRQSLRTTMPPSLVADADADADAPSNPTGILLSSSATSRQREQLTSYLGRPHFSMQRSSVNLWTWGEVNECMSNNKRSNSVSVGGGEDDNLGLGVSAMKMKKRMKGRRKVREPRFCFKTMSDVDVLDDGYKWRKYGQKVVKNTLHPRSYYRCTQDNCRVKKRVERLAEDPRMVITTYEGRHAHSPSHDDEDDSQALSQFNNFF